MDLELLVIGDSAAGLQGAVTAAQLGRTVGLICPVPAEATQYDLRQIPERVLHDTCADWAGWRPVLNVRRHPTDAGRWRQFAAAVHSTWQREVELYLDHILAAGGRIWQGTAALLGPQTVCVTTAISAGTRIEAEQIIIATGTRSERPRFAADDLPQVQNAADLLLAPAVTREACVIGASVTGLRAACLLAWWGCTVRMIDGRSSDGCLDDDTAGLVSWAEQLGVTFEFGEDVIGLESVGARHTELTMESGRRFTTEAVWLATGRLGRTEGLQLENAELSADDRGRLWCGSELRTWTPTISAVGDVVGFTQEEGSEEELVAAAIAGVFGDPMESGLRQTALPARISS